MEGGLTTATITDGDTQTTVAAPHHKIGPYRLLAPLGKGATGVVFRAVHDGTGEEVALKTLRAVDPTELASLRREVHALSRLRNPGVVAIREQGIEGGIPWYAMELIDGDTIDSLWRASGDGGATRSLSHPRTSQAFKAMQRLCDTLAFLHGEGIVHRDVKPANVILRSDGAPVLVDFGFAARFAAESSREALEVGGEILGSLPYIAPEQAKGEFVDARADLYSVGCILYEIVTGRPPFVGTPWEVLRQHQAVVPAPPSTLVEGVPPTVDQLIVRLLAKNPYERIGYAVDVSAQLAALGAEADDGEPLGSRMYLYRPTFAGRTRHLEALVSSVQRLRQGRGDLVLISGESGVGKTRLAMEATRRATAEGVVVVSGQCVSLDGAPDASETQGGPLHPLVPLLRYIADYCRAGGQQVSSRIVGRRGKVLASYEPTLATLPGHELYADPIPLQAQAARERLVGDLAETLSQFAKDVRLVVVLDDLQWADELTLHTLASLPARFYESAPLLVIACYRIDEAGPELRAFESAGRHTRFTLGRLDPPTVGAIVSDMLAIRDVPEPLVQFLARESEGNPFFVSEYLRMVVGERLLVRTSQSEWRVATSDVAMERVYESLPLPHTVRELVSRRLGDVDPGARRIIAAGAVLGREFELSLASAVAGLDDDAQMAAVTQLLARQIVEDVTGNRLRFAHDKLREVAYQRLTPPQLRDLHCRSAVAIESQYRDSPTFSHWYGPLAVHWSGAGDDRRAAEYFARAGEGALVAGAAGDARGMLTRALACEERCTPRLPRLQRAGWTRMLGEAAYGVGDIAGAIEHASVVLRALDYSVPRTLPGWLGQFLAECVELVAARDATKRGVPAVELREAAMAAGQVAQPSYLKSEVLAGVVSSLRCMNLARAAGTPGAATQSYAQVGYIAGAARITPVAKRCFERARSLRDIADPNVFGGSLYFEALYNMGIGHWERSQTLAEEALSLLERIGNRQEAEIANAIVANSLYYEGRFNEAEERCKLMLESARARGNVHHTAWGLFLGGRSLLCLGRLPEALAAIVEGRNLLSPLDDVLSKIMCDGSLSRAYLYAGRCDDARAIVAELEALVRSRWVIPLAQCLDGVGALPEVQISLTRASTGSSLAPSTRYACRALRRFARMFPIAKPAALRHAATLLWDAGHRRIAVWWWQRSVKMARQLRMPYEEARSHEILCVHGAGAAARRFHASEAERLYERLGCAHHLVELQRSREAGHGCW